MKNLIVLLGILLLVGCKSTENITNQSKNNYPKMNLKDLHTEDKAVQTKLLLKAEEGKVISLQIASGEQLKEHVSNVPTILICVSGKAVYKDESGDVTLKAGDYVMITQDVKHEVSAITDSNFILIK
ncbi:cupin domain-containing protein [Psychroserpens ponticola]|uniref:Cupin domain-containing protein n=1 Tax=Psychroserpens ponticola TaxID=2932268 RepID=A0ABY7S0F6_9FLAO|nr:cupin domain-containing protein [Psychroserpens ponticola]WCO02876.1 cupin domain-containing protein [Psychroserpens ponticola]